MKPVPVKKTAKTRYNAVLVSAMVVVAASLALPSQARTLPRTAEILPRETVLLLEVADLNQTRHQLEKTTFYKLYTDPVMAGFIESVRAKFQQRLHAADSPLEKMLSEPNMWPSGRLALALVLNERTKDAERAPFLMISQWGDNVSRIKEAVNKATENAVSEGSHRQTEEYRGATIITMTEPSSGSTQNPADRTSHCFVDDCLLVSADLDSLKFAVAHIDGASGETLADDSDYSAAMAATGPHHDVDFYSNLKQIFRTASAGDSTGETQRAFADWGLDNISGIGCSLGFARSPGCPFAGKAIVRVNGAKRGICRMLETESGSIAAPRFVPASAYSLTILNLGIRKAYDELYSILSKAEPEGAAALNTPLVVPAADGEPGVSLRADIINHLGSQIIIAQNSKKPFVASSVPAETLFTAAVTNRAALEKSLSLCHAQMVAQNDPDSRREVLGYTIYLLKHRFPFLGPGLKPLQGPVEPASQRVPTMAFTVTNTHLIMGEESAVERAIRTLASTDNSASIGSAAWWSAARQNVPSTAGLAAFEDSAASAEILWWMLKETARTDRATALGMGALFFGAPDVTALGDFNLLPQFDAVRKYFGSSVFFGGSRTDGFFFEFKYIDAPAGD